MGFARFLGRGVPVLQVFSAARGEGGGSRTCLLKSTSCHPHDQGRRWHIPMEAKPPESLLPSGQKFSPCPPPSDGQARDVSRAPKGRTACKSW